MMKHYLLIVGFTLVSLNQFWAQEEDEACLPPAKKIMKLIEAGKMAPDAKTAVENFTKAIESNPDNATVYFEYGLYAFETGKKLYERNPNPAMGDKSFQKAKEMFTETLNHCSDFNADCYYYLGVINYAQKNMTEAVKWFNAFKKFNHKDFKRFPADYDKKLVDVNNILPELEAEVELKNNIVPFNPKMVPNVSSTRDEYFPMISPDNEIMFFTRKDTVDDINTGMFQRPVYENFTFAQRPNVASDFDKGMPLKFPFNEHNPSKSEYFTNYGAATMSVDNKEMIICACKPTKVNGQDYLNCDLYRTEYQHTGNGWADYTWTPLENLGPNINTPNGWEGQPTLSPDGNTMYFTAMRPTTDDNDIYVAYRDPKTGKWGKAEPFTHINTTGKDKSPFLHQDSETLYFVSGDSEKRKGFGGLDIYYIKKDSTGKWWDKPKNIGYPINSENDEIGIFVSTDGTLAYFSSRNNSANWNIFEFELYEEARPTGVTILKGDLKDADGNPIQNAEIEVAYEGGEVSKVKVNGNDGKFATVVKNTTNKDVMVTIKKDGAAFDSKLITKEELAATRPISTATLNNSSNTFASTDKPNQSKSEKAVEKTKNNSITSSSETETTKAKLTTIERPKDVSIRGNELIVKPVKVGEAYTINDILFETNSYELSNRSKFILQQFARFLIENKTISIMIQGHTDDVGDDNQNLLLSEGRAKAVMEYLISLKIDASRLQYKGFGETMPKLPNTSEENRAKNRRTDFVIEKM